MCLLAPDVGAVADAMRCEATDATSRDRRHAAACSSRVGRRIDGDVFCDRQRCLSLRSLNINESQRLRVDIGIIIVEVQLSQSIDERTFNWTMTPVDCCIEDSFNGVRHLMRHHVSAWDACVDCVLSTCPRITLVIASLNACVKGRLFNY